MSTFPNSPRLVKGGLVLIDADTSAVQRIIVLQYNPDTLSRTLQPQAVKESGDRAEAMRLTGPPVETIKLDAEIDATDQLEFPDQHANAVQFGIQPQLAALETILYPASAQLLSNNALASAGMLEILPTLVGVDPVCLEQEPHRAGAHHRFQRHRRSVRYGAQSAARQSQPRHARAERDRSRLRQ